MTIRNTSRYTTEEVRELVRLAVSEVDMSGVCVNVKNSTHAFGGMAYESVPTISNAPPSAEHLVTVRIGREEKFPLVDHRCYHARGTRGDWPVVTLSDWREALVYVAAHEAKHIEQFKEGKPTSELACEHFAAYTLRSYRLILR